VRRFPLALMGLVILVSACTTRPENVEARYVSQNDYSKWTCPQLYDERARVTSEVERVSGLQRDNANGDAGDGRHPRPLRGAGPPQGSL